MMSSRKRRSDGTSTIDHKSSGRSTAAMTPANDLQVVKRVKRERIENNTELKSFKAKTEIHNTLYDDIVFVKVGPAQVKFGIHRGLLTKASTFFGDILKPGYKSSAKDVVVCSQGDSTVVMLTDENPETFSRVNSWLYSGEFLTANESWKEIPWTHVICVYLFSVERSFSRLHNKCIDAAILKTKDGGLFPSQSTINALYKLDIRAAPLRELFIKLFAARCDLKSAILTNSAYHQTFLNWLVIELYEMQKQDVKSEDIDIWGSRETYYAYGSENPISVD